MANAHDFQDFHLELYELRWRHNGMPDGTSTRVHGELYTSPKFLGSTRGNPGTIRGAWMFLCPEF